MNLQEILSEVVEIQKIDKTEELNYMIKIYNDKTKVPNPELQIGLGIGIKNILENTIVFIKLKDNSIISVNHKLTESLNVPIITIKERLSYRYNDEKDLSKGWSKIN